VTIGGNAEKGRGVSLGSWVVARWAGLPPAHTYKVGVPPTAASGHYFNRQIQKAIEPGSALRIEPASPRADGDLRGAYRNHLASLGPGVEPVESPDEFLLPDRAFGEGRTVNSMAKVALAPDSVGKPPW
jgi:hypothetical protein